MWQQPDILLNTYFSFDEVRLKSDVKNAIINYNVMVVQILTRSHLDLSNSALSDCNLADLTKNCM